MRRTTLYFLTLLLVFAGFESMAQVTTSSMSGVVKDDKGQPLVGATVTLRNESTGARFTVTTRTGGIFDINNLPPGGPYSVKVSYVGFTDFNREDINIPLGEKFDLQTTLNPTNTELQVVTVSAARRGATEKTGASTNISNRAVQNLPNISRSLTNLTRITPQSNDNGFAGMNKRYNNITIDGSLFNNNFGRGGDGMIPGGAVSAISIDAIDQVQVNIAPFDVRQAGFIGSGINAVTRRGTNNWYGTIYGFYRNQDFTGKKVLERTVDNPNRSNKTFGASLGGPIIKDKLFFFVNYEMEDRTQPGQTFVSKKAGENNPNATAVSDDSLKAVRQYLISQYKYDPGEYEGYDFKTDNKKFLARIDWNITSKHRLTLRYQQSETNDDDQINSASTTGVSADRINNSRRGGSNGGMAFSGSNFKNNVKVWSGVMELNSNFNSIVSNQLIASYTDNQLKRVPNTTASFVDIMRAGDKNNVQISFGTDLFSYRNEISDKAFNIADNVTINLGKHTLTAGASYEYLKFANSFTSAGGPSYYRYASVGDFINGRPPVHFGVAYDPNNRLGIKVPEATFAQLGLYLQDAWTVSSKFKLTYGIRFDKPAYPYDPPKNPALAALTFKDADGNNEQFDVSKWPKARILVSPRVGFSYDVDGDKQTIVRGGTGLFTGRIPFIWLVNQVGDNGVIRAIYQSNDPAILDDIDYSLDRTAHIPATVPPVGTSIPNGSNFSAIDKDFKMPQVWRTNLAIDKKFEGNYTFTLEGLYTKFINNPFFRNANLGAQTGVIEGIDRRPFFTSALNSAVNQMVVLDNTSKGYSLALTAAVQKSFSKNWEAGIAYTYTLAQEASIGSSDQSGSGWTTNNIAVNPNIPELGQSNYSVPHRIVANGSYRFEYRQKTMATTIGFFYSAQPQERYSFRYGANINGDNASNDILYIPKDPSEIKFVEGFKPTPTSTPITAQAQSDAFFAFIENDKYLRKHKGQTMEKYGAMLPWYHSLDMRVLQDFSFRTGTKKHTIQLSLDVINLLNLLNSNWGYRYQYTFGTFQDMGIVGTASSSNNTGGLSYSRANPLFTFDPNGPKKAYQAAYNTTSTWGLQLGLRYIFN
jgi:hypothetical protein